LSCADNLGGETMKKWVADKLICPECIEEQVRLELKIMENISDDVLEGELYCSSCSGRYPIREGIGIVLPKKTRGVIMEDRGYNAPNMLSAYMWSHFCDLINDPQATEAYRVWSANFQESEGDALDIGCAVGRLSFDLSKSHKRVIGIDTSIAFIRKAREILNRKQIDFDLIVEGHITEPRTCNLNGNWDLGSVDFIVADALALPFPEHSFTTVAAINILEKVPDPMKHLFEVDRVLKENDATFLFSDPFSWDEAVSPPELWLSGNGNEQYSPRGIDTMRRLFAGEYGVFKPPFRIRADGNVSWKIRKTANLWEYITSQYLIGSRA